MTTTTILDRHLFGIVDQQYPGEVIPAPHETGASVRVGRSSILVESPYDNLDAILRLEEWDAEPSLNSWDDGAPWDYVLTVAVECPAGVIRLDQITMGWADTGFSLTRPGAYHVGVASRNGAAAWQAYLDTLARFDDTSSRECLDATARIELKEEYLVRFWPAAASPRSSRPDPTTTPV